jgi:hypothetical protein
MSAILSVVLLIGGSLLVGRHTQPHLLKLPLHLLQGQLKGLPLGWGVVLCSLGEVVLEGVEDMLGLEQVPLLQLLPPERQHLLVALYQVARLLGLQRGLVVFVHWTIDYKNAWGSLLS